MAVLTPPNSTESQCFVDSIAEARLLPPGRYTLVWIIGSSANIYRWNASDTTADNGTTVLAPAQGGTGRLNELAGIKFIDVSWTPSISCATVGNLSVSYTLQSGYVAIENNIADVWFAIQTSAFTWTTASGQVQINGLPINCSALANHYVECELLYSGITKANYTNFFATIAPSSGTLFLTASGSGQSYSALNIADMPTGGLVILRGHIRFYAA